MNEEVNENLKGFLLENIQFDDLVLNNFDNLMVKNREEFVNNRDEEVKRKEYIEF